MIPEFIAFNKVTKKMFEVNDINGLLQNTVVCCKHGDACECMAGIDGYEDEVDLYQYIGRKDKDGNKVYEGSRISAGSYKYIIRYDNEACEFSATRITKDKSVLKINIGSLSSNCKIKVIGHIAKEAPNGQNKTLP